jgi:hypothetical protein
LHSRRIVAEIPPVVGGQEAGLFQPRFLREDFTCDGGQAERNREAAPGDLRDWLVLVLTVWDLPNHTSHAGKRPYPKFRQELVETSYVQTPALVVGIRGGTGGAVFLTFEELVRKNRSASELITANGKPIWRRVLTFAQFDGTSEPHSFEYALSLNVPDDVGDWATIVKILDRRIAARKMEACRWQNQKMRKSSEVSLMLTLSKMNPVFTTWKPAFDRIRQEAVARVRKWQNQPEVQRLPV